jgi:predicted nucleic acid-binding Zn ribbon protein
LQRFSDPPADACVACGGPVSQILSAPAIQFKGSGWYVTDYAHKSSSSPSSGNGKHNGDSSPAPAENKTTTTTEKTSAEKASTEKK